MNGLFQFCLPESFRPREFLRTPSCGDLVTNRAGPPCTEIVEDSLMAKNELIVQPFDYELVSNDEAGKLQCLAGEIARGRKKHADAIIETGESLVAAQDVLSKHGSGTFQKWVEAECGFTPKTAYNYISAYEQFGDCEIISQIEPTAMYALAKNEPAKKKALTLMEKGVKITSAIANKLIKAVKEAAAAASGGGGGEPDPAEEEAAEELPDGLAERVVEAVSSNEIEADGQQLEAFAQYDESSQEDLLEDILADRQTLDQAIESGEAIGPTVEDRMKSDNTDIESWCRELTKLWASSPDTPWFGHFGCFETATQQFKSALKTVRTSKGKDVCPECEGGGCAKCRDTGYVPGKISSQLG